jgi:hypothetical protein
VARDRYKAVAAVTPSSAPTCFHLLFLRPERSGPRAPLERRGRVAAGTLARNREQRLELALIEEAQFGSVFARRR